MLKSIINKIETELNNTFNEVDACFDVSINLLNYKPSTGGWSIKEVLEHISLTNHFLLILIKKGTSKAIVLSKENDFSKLLVNYDLDWDKLNAIGEHGSFEWSRPRHMEPTGTEDLFLVRERIKDQVNECLYCLKQMQHGEGVLYKTMMTVNGLGKIDVYHYIYFVSEHARRHLMQIQKIKTEYEKQN